MIPPLQSLVKYDNPVLVSTTAKKKDKGTRRKKDLPPVEQKPGITQTEDILNSILPPREWTEDGQLWVQYVSSTPATRLDVINLQEKLDHQVRPPSTSPAPFPARPVEFGVLEGRRGMSEWPERGGGGPSGGRRRARRGAGRGRPGAPATPWAHHRGDRSDGSPAPALRRPRGGDLSEGCLQPGGRGRVRPASGGGGPEGEASGVPREACWPGDLASPPDRSPPRAPPLCHPLLLWKPLCVEVKTWRRTSGG